MSTSDKPAMSEIVEAAEILRQYAEPHSMIDNGNLFFAATAYQDAFKELEAENSRLREALRKVCLWGECVLARMPRHETVNVTYLIQARDALNPTDKPASHSDPT